MVSRRFAKLSTRDGPRFALLEGGQALELDAPPWASGSPTGVTSSWSHEDLLCPADPSKIIGVGKNYRSHARELGGQVPAQPLLFLKPPSALLDPNGTVVLPHQSQRVDYEGELGIVIGRRGRRIPLDSALEHVLGYTIVCDVTARDLQQSDGQWARAKGFDTFCPVGPWITQGVDAQSLRLTLKVNGNVRQAGSTADMVFKIGELISFASDVMTLEPGDLIATGTPEGIGPLAPGDQVSVEIEQLGQLCFQVASE